MPFKEDKEELLQNPMLDPDLDKVDFSNPMFDHKKALVRDAAVTIQSWYRMWRERIPFLQKKEAATIIQVGNYIRVMYFHPMYVHIRGLIGTVGLYCEVHNELNKNNPVMGLGR